MQNHKIAYRARYIFPVASPPIAGGVVAVENGHVASVGLDPPDCAAMDLGNVAIFPALINAHTHLEFSGLSTPLGSAGIEFTDWVRLVVSHRRSQPMAANDVAQGRDECSRCGQAAIGEIARTPWSDAATSCPLEGTVFLESIGLKRELIKERLATARQYLEAVNLPSQWRRGLSPHAPYSVHPELFDGLVSLAKSCSAPAAFHLAETREELELLATGGGPFRDLLIDLGAWEADAIPRGTRPLDYLRRLAASGVSSLIIHGNYLDDEEMGYVARHSERMTVVYCPRTHAFFGHPKHPLPRLLAAGANVALGTDSRASNPNLDLLAEMRFVARHFPEVPPATVLELGTLRAARALELDERLGSIEPGKAARFAVLPLGDRDAADPHELVFESDQSATALG